MAPHGLFYLFQTQHIPVPLLEVRAKAIIKDLAASVQLSQVFTNESADTIECTYFFPIPARAAVYSFHLVKEDGTKVVGIVQEKEEARETYDQAVSEGKLASLMEQETPDTFTVSVGNVLPRERVTVELTYATELTEDEANDSIRFHLPAHIGARYGPPSSTKLSPASISLSPSSSTSFFHLDLSIESVAPIRQIGSPSHTISTSLGPDPSLPNAKELPFSNYARVTFASDTVLSKDFILTLQSGGLDAPRCMAEQHLSPDHNTAAISLSFVPKFKLPDVESQEYLFLVDRSGSMNGERMSMARKALVVLLRSLPRSGTSFNLISFGSNHSSLWQESREYSQTTLDHATRHVDNMEANFGGTEMKAALEGTFSKRSKAKPTSLFVLTDGDAWDLDGVYSTVTTAVAAASPSAPLRIFVLGIGNSASTAMVEGIARRGNGAAQFVVDGESLTGKMARLLKASKSPQLLNIRLELPESKEAPEYSQEKADDGFELLDDEEDETEKDEKDEPALPPAASLGSLSLFDESEDPLAKPEDQPFTPPSLVDLPPPPPIQQAPHKIHNLFPGTRVHSYLILSPASLLPRSIFLRAELASGQKLELDIPVTQSTLIGDFAIHVLAARKLIQDLEDGRHEPKVDEAGGEEQLTRASIVRLGKTYSLASKYTSFVAVDESEVDSKRKQSARRIARPPPPAAPMPFFAQARGFGALPGGAPRMRTMAAGGGGGGSNMLFGAPKPAPFSSPVAPAARNSSGGVFGRAVQMFSTSSAPAPSGASPWDAMPAPPPAPAPMATSFASPSLFPTASQAFSMPSFGSPAPPPAVPYGAPPPPSFGGAAPSFGFSPPVVIPDDSDPSTSDRIDRLARLQGFDGSFDPAAMPLCTLASKSPNLAEILTYLARIRIAPLVRFSSLDEATRDKIVATAVVVAFWKKSLEKQRDEWEGMAEKAFEFGGEQIGEDEFEQLMGRISGFV